MPVSIRHVIALTRVGAGLATLLAPATGARIFGVDPERSDDWMTRVFGSRELLLGLSLLAAKGPQVRTIALLGASVDAVDAVSSGIEMRRGNLSTYTTIAGGGGALLFAVLGLLAAREADADGST